MNKHNYPTNLTDRQWEYIKNLIPQATTGRPRLLDLRQVINALLYVVVGGIQWRMLPSDFPKWQSVYYYFRTWRDKGLWQRMHDRLRALVRHQAGRHKHATAGCLDSQSSRQPTSLGCAATTAVSVSRDASAIYWWTLWG